MMHVPFLYPMCLLLLMRTLRRLVRGRRLLMRAKMHRCHSNTWEEEEEEEEKEKEEEEQEEEEALLGRSALEAGRGPCGAASGCCGCSSSGSASAPPTPSARR